MCDTGKVEYKTAKEVWRIKSKMHKPHGKADPYRCSICGFWHTGRKKAK